MIFLIQSSGNHSNRLIQHMHLEAFCLANNIKFYNPTLANMLKPYKMSKEFNFFKAYLYNFLFKIIIMIYKLTKLKIVNFIDLDSIENKDECFNILKNKKNLYIIGWSFRDYDSLLKFKERFIEKFSLLIPLNNGLLKYIENDNVKLAIHIRRGDYIEWHNGKFYYTDDQYIDFIKRTIEIIGKPANLYFFSNEKLDEKKFKDEFGEDVYFSNNPYYIDHYLMSCCDFIIGPPSTFTSYASFLGKAKVYHINEPERKITLDDFKKSRG